MSMPQHFNIAVIAENHEGGSDLAASAAGILRSLGDVGYAPYYVASSTFKLSPALTKYGLKRDIIIAQPVKPLLLNASKIHLWLALDEVGVETARRIIKQTGPAPDSFYSQFFPDAVVSAKVTMSVPSKWSEEFFNSWLDALIGDLTPWSKQIWEVFYESS